MQHLESTQWPAVEIYLGESGSEIESSVDEEDVDWANMDELSVFVKSTSIVQNEPMIANCEFYAISTEEGPQPACELPARLGEGSSAAL